VAVPFAFWEEVYWLHGPRQPYKMSYSTKPPESNTRSSCTATRLLHRKCEVSFCLINVKGDKLLPSCARCQKLKQTCSREPFSSKFHHGRGRNHKDDDYSHRQSPYQFSRKALPADSLVGQGSISRMDCAPKQFQLSRNSEILIPRVVPPIAARVLSPRRNSLDHPQKTVIFRSTLLKSTPASFLNQ